MRDWDDHQWRKWAIEQAILGGAQRGNIIAIALDLLEYVFPGRDWGLVEDADRVEYA